MWKECICLMALALLLSLTAGSNADIPVAYWDFNDLDGSLLRDRIGSADGTCTAGVTFVPGVYGNAGSIPADDFVSLGNPGVLDLGRGDLVYTGWFKTDTVPYEGYNLIIEFGKHNAGGLNIWVGPGNRGWQGKLGFDAKGTADADNISLFSNDRVDDGQWHWFACVVDNLNMSMYIDGLLQDAQPSYGPTTTANAPETLDQKIGTNYNGLVDDLALYDRALSGVLDDDGYLIAGALYDLWREGVLVSSLRAWAPAPAEGEIGVSKDTLLNWRPGYYADKHNVYFGTSEHSLAPISLNQDANTCDPGTLELGQSYYWRVDEVNGPDTWTGKVWSFTVRDYVIVDDMEDYNEVTNPIANNWTDGGGINSGSIVSLATVPHEGEQSLIFDYNNAGPTPYYSEIEANAIDLGTAQDWTVEGVEALDLWFEGDPCNVAEQMYVALFDGVNTAVVVNPDVSSVKVDTWSVWHIALTEFTDANPSLDLTGISKIYIGFGDRDNHPSPGGSGRVYFDDIRLYLPRCLNVDDCDLTYDFNGDCVVNFEDFAVFMQSWGNSGIWPF